MRVRRNEEKEGNKGRFCPYCEETLAGALSEYCRACQIKTFVCPVCHVPISREKRVCPECGTEIG